MNYIGKLYGRLNGTVYFATGKTTDDWDNAIKLLRNLADLQNGPPLVKEEKEYNETIDKVYEFLKQHEPDTQTI